MDLRSQSQCSCMSSRRTNDPEAHEPPHTCFSTVDRVTRHPGFGSRSEVKFAKAPSRLCPHTSIYLEVSGVRTTALHSDSGRGLAIVWAVCALAEDRWVADWPGKHQCLMVAMLCEMKNCGDK